MSKPYSSPRERVWDMVIKQLIARYLICHVNPVMMSVMAITKVRLAIFLHSRVRFLLCSSSWLKTLLAQRTSHASNSLSTQTEILNFLVNHVSCDWILCCDWYTLHGAWWWTTIWPGPRPFPSVRPRKANIYQHLTHMVVQVPGISAGNDQCTTRMICPTLAWHQML